MGQENNEQKEVQTTTNEEKVVEKVVEVEKVVVPEIKIVQEQPKKNSGLKLLLFLFALIILALGGYIVYEKFLSKENKTEVKDEVKEEEVKLNSKFEGLYGFKIMDYNIYALLENETEIEIIKNYHEQVVNVEGWGTKGFEYFGPDIYSGSWGVIDYEYLNGKLYIYMGAKYKGQNPQNVSIYSIDLTKEEIVLNKEYNIDNVGSVSNFAQDGNYIYYHGYESINTSLKHTIYSFNKKTNEVRVIYSIPNDVTFEEMIIKNNNLFLAYRTNKGSKGYLLNINLTNNETKIVAENVNYLGYDDINKNIILRDNTYLTVKTFNTTTFQDENTSVTNKIQSTRVCYSEMCSLDNIIVKLHYSENDGYSITIDGMKNYTIKLNDYLKVTKPISVVTVDLIDNYSVFVTVGHESGDFYAYPDFLVISLKDGSVKTVDNYSDYAKYLYIK